MGNFIMTIITFVITCIFLWESNKIDIPIRNSQLITPDFWPKAILFVLIILSAFACIISWKEKDKTGFEHQRKVLFNLILIWCILFLYIFLVPYFGFIIVTVLYLAFFTYLMGLRKIFFSFGLGFILTIISVFIFGRLLLIPFPVGVGIFKTISMIFY